MRILVRGATAQVDDAPPRLLDKSETKAVATGREKYSPMAAFIPVLSQPLEVLQQAGNRSSSRSCIRAYSPWSLSQRSASSAGNVQLIYQKSSNVRMMASSWYVLFLVEIVNSDVEIDRSVEVGVRLLVLGVVSPHCCLNLKHGF